MTRDNSGMNITRWVWAAIAVLLVVVPGLPLPAWLNGPDAGPIWAANLVSWGIGALVVVVGGLLAGRLATRLRIPSLPSLSPWALVIAMAGAFALLTALCADLVFARNPHLVDEMAQLLHARAFAAGKLALPRPEPPEFFLITHTGITEAGWVSQYPPGHIVLLAVGLLLGGAWLINPLLGGISVILVFLFARGLYDSRTGITAALLYAGSAWTLFTSATYMNHVSAGAYALGAWAAVWATPRPNYRHWLAAGLLLAACAATRPLDALAAGLPVALRLLGTGRVTGAAWIALGAAPVAVTWGYINARLYGSPFTLGYTAVYGPEHGLGFHTDPWGLVYTPQTALSNMGAALRRLHIYAYEWPIPALLPLAVWALFARRKTHGDLAIGITFLAVPLLYFFYWHSGYYLGPRLYFLLAPLIAIGSARAWWWAWDHAHAITIPVAGGPAAVPSRFIRWDVALASTAVFVLLWGWISLLPRRWEVYREGLRSLKHHPEVQLQAAGVRQALIIIPESWGSRIGVMLWGMGVPPGLVERAYRRLDACDLHLFTVRARRQGSSARLLVDSLESMVSRAGEPPPLVTRWPDPTLRLQARESIPTDCAIELSRDLQGFTLYGNHAWRNSLNRDRGLVFARDLYQRNAELFERYHGWEVWRYGPAPGSGNEDPVLTPVNPRAEDGSR